MENSKKNGLMIGIIYAVIFFAYNLSIFLFMKNFNSIFWISYGFMIAAFALHIICVYFICRNLSVQAAFFGIPLLSFSFYFVCAELFCSLVFMMFRTMVSVKIAVLIQTLLLGAFMIVAVISVITRDVVQNVDDKIKENVNFIKGLNVDIEMMVLGCKSPDALGALKHLSETIKYSDPMSNHVVATQEQMILQYMVELRNMFDLGDMEKIKELCSKIELLFIDRNKRLMVSK